VIPIVYDVRGHAAPNQKVPLALKKFKFPLLYVNLIISENSLHPSPLKAVPTQYD
jgi:hypothetical protein